MENKQVAIKNDFGKVQYSDLPSYTLESVAHVFNYGQQKYSKFNYLQGMEWLRYYDACLRHMQTWYRGDDKDKESNLHHIDHAIASLCMLRENIHLQVGQDNRFKYESKDKKVTS